MSVSLGDYISGISVWQIIRATGLAAYMMLFLSVALGIIQSIRIMPKKSRADLAYLHSGFSWLGLVAIFIHTTSLYFDQYISYSIPEILLPFTSDFKPLETSTGILALYIIFILILSNILRTKFTITTRRNIHYLSYAGFLGALVHGLYIGNDSGEPLVYGMYMVTATIVALLSVVRGGLHLAQKGAHRADTISGR